MKYVNYQVNKQQYLSYLVRCAFSVCLFVITNFLCNMHLQNVAVIPFLSYMSYCEVRHYGGMKYSSMHS